MEKSGFVLALFPHGTPTVRCDYLRVLSGEHTINASWEAAQALSHFKDLTEAVDLIVEEVPVNYSEVAARVPILWRDHAPDLVIHCGVSALIAWRKIIQIERHAHSSGYQRPDICSAVPSDGGCESECLKTLIDLDHLITAEEAEESEQCAISCQISDDAGRYLCEYIYYTSLKINPRCTLFIHVPPLYKPYTPTEIARAIKRVILKIVQKNQVVLAEEINMEVPIEPIAAVFM